MNTSLSHRLGRPTVYLLGLVSVAVALSVSLQAQKPTLEPGKYEKTSEQSMPGRPARPPRKDTVCLGADDVRDFSKVAAQVADDKVTCNVSDYKVNGATVTFTKSCPLPGGATLLLDVTMTLTSSDSYRGTATVRNSGFAGLPAGMTTTTTAKRIGSCSK